MKKYLLLLILFPIVGMGQTYSNPYTPTQQVNVTVKKDPNDFSTSFSQGMQAGAAVRQAAAAQQTAATQQELIDNQKRIERENKDNANPNSIINRARALKTIKPQEMTSEDALNELKKAKDKLDLGLISKEDYEAKKTELVKFIN